MCASHILPLAAFGNFFGVDGLVVLILGLLIFGRKLPDVGKNIGRTIVEFKKGLSGSYSNDEKLTEESEEPAPPKRLQSGSRVSVSAPRAKSLPQTEEV